MRFRVGWLVGLCLVLLCAILVRLPQGLKPLTKVQPVAVDLAHLGGFEEVLFPVGGTPSEAENQALEGALRQYRQGPRNSLDRFQGLEAFLQTYPNSPWKASLRFNLGMAYYSSGRFTLGISSLRECWTLLRDSQEPKARATADLALAQLCRKLSVLGRYEELEPLLKESKGRSLTGSSTEWMTQAWESLALLRTEPERAFQCGPMALGRLCQAKGLKTPELKKLLANCQGSPQGTSLTQLANMAEQVGLPSQMAYRKPGSPMLTPAIVHFQLGHFATVLEPTEGQYPVQDVVTSRLMMDPQVMDLEASGYFLVRPGTLPEGWRPVSQAEGSKVFGRGDPGPGKDPGGTTDFDPTAFQCTRPGPITTWDAHAMLVSLALQDTPVGTSPAAFAIPFQVKYAQRNTEQPAVFDYPNLGRKWHCNWISFVTDHRTDGGINGIQVHLGGGGVENFEQVNPTGTFAQQRETKPGIFTQSRMSDVPNGFARDFPDGSREVFDKQIGNRFFLTSRRDPHGNTVTLNWDGSRLVSIQDPVGRVMTLSYELADDPLKITKVTDFAGRSAVFTYQAQRLASITDILGITSSFDWANNDFIQNLTTPYGTTHFAYIDNSFDFNLGYQRVLTITDATGRNYRVECRANAPVAFEDPNPPQGMTVLNGFLNYRTTFSWTPAQLAGGTPDYNKATQLHFVHGRDFWLDNGQLGSGGTGRVLESMKKPDQRRLWFFYPTAFGFPFYPSSNQPTHIGKVLADGTTQLTRFTYNALGNPTSKIDPAGREYLYTYDSNGIDVTSVSVNGQALMSATYDAQHNPLQVTGSSGGTSHFTYNARGQVESATNELGETTTYAYTADGNLSSIQSPLNAVTSFAYDAVGRVASATDSEGYTVQASYDNADRPTQVTYPDGSTENLTYDRLDLVETRDRNGRTTQYQFDAERRLAQVTDGNGGVTTLGYSEFDSPTSLVDPGGRATLFGYDINAQPIVKQYSGGGTQVTTYWPCCNQVRSITDALGHSKTYNYNPDNTLKNVIYSGTTPQVSFQYDTLLPRPISMTDGQGTTTYNYVPIGSPGANALASISAGNDTASFQYDLAGRMTGRTVNGQSETQTFDALWRTTSTTNALDTFNLSYLGTTGQVTGINSTLGPNLQYTYGSNAQNRRLMQIQNLGRVSGAVQSQFAYTYDPVGQITQMVETHGGGGSTNTTTPTPTPTCDDDDHGHHHKCHKKCCHEGNCCHTGKCCKKKCCKGKGECGKNECKEHGRGHDDDDRDHRDGYGMTPPGGFDPRGPISALMLGLWGVLMVQFVCMPRARTRVLARVTIGALIGSLALNGCLQTTATPTGTTDTFNFSYDNLGQLIGVNLNQQPNSTFSFDPSGNLLSMVVNGTTSTFTYNSLNQPTTPGTNVFDAKGQTTDQNGRQYEWDDDGRCTAIIVGTARSEFSYDGYGRRVRIVEKNGATVTSDKKYFWIGGSIVTERDALQAGAPITKRYFGQGVVANGTKLFYTFDHLGSVRELVDDTGAIRADYRYDTYGTRTKVSGDLDADFGYAGLFHHTPTGLDLATYRIYDSTQHRWLSRDPLGEGVDLNLYRYCGNDPIGCVDPDGLLPTKPRKKKPIEIHRVKCVPAAGYQVAGTVVFNNDHLDILIDNSLSAKDQEIVLANEMQNAKDMLTAWNKHKYPGWTAQEMLDSEIESFISEMKKSTELGGPSDPRLKPSDQILKSILSSGMTEAQKRNAIMNLMAQGTLGQSYQDLYKRAMTGGGFPEPFSGVK